MNKETENEKLASTIVKLMEKEMDERNKLIADSFAQLFGARVDHLMSIVERERKIDSFSQKQLAREFFIEGTKFAILFTAVSVFVGSLFAWSSFLLMAIIHDNHLGYWIAFAVAFVLFIGSPIIGGKFLPGSLKYWWGILKDKMMKSKLKWIVILLGRVVNLSKRFLRIVRRA